MIVLLDQDGVLADFEGGFVKAWNGRFRDIAAIPVEARRNFRLRDDYPEHLLKQVAEVYSAPGFFRNLEPVAGAIAAVSEMMAGGIEVWICTSPIDNYENCVLEKYQWVEEHLGRAFTRRMILTKDKTLVGGDWLIDDNPEIVGSRTPEWTQLVFDAPCNRHLVNTPRLDWSNWKSVLGQAAGIPRRRAHE